MNRHVTAAITAGLALSMTAGSMPMPAIAEALQGVDGISIAAGAAPAQQAAPQDQTAQGDSETGAGNDKQADEAVSITALPDITLGAGGTATLPGTVAVQFKSGKTEQRSVVWESQDADGTDLSKLAAGVYEFRGSVAGISLAASQRVMVQPAAQVDVTENPSEATNDGAQLAEDLPTPQTAPAQTADYSSKQVVSIDPVSVNTLVNVLPTQGGGSTLPQRTRVVYSDGSAETVNIDWYREGVFTADIVSKPGMKQIDVPLANQSGPLQGKQVRCNLKVQQVQKLEDVSVLTTTGIKPNLPSFIDVVLWDGSRISSIADWDPIDSSQYAQPGSFEVYGHLRDTGMPVKATVDVFDLADPVVLELLGAPNADIALPTYVLARLSDGEQYPLQILEWNAIPQEFEDGAVDEATIEGTATIGNYYSDTVAADFGTVTVKAHLKRAQFDAKKTSPRDNEFTGTIYKGETLRPFTDNGTAVCKNGTIATDLAIEWDDYDPQPTENTILHGHIAGTDIPTSMKVYVIDPDAITVPTLKGVSLKGVPSPKVLPAWIDVPLTEAEEFLGGEWTLRVSDITWDTASVDWSKGGMINGEGRMMFWNDDKGLVEKKIPLQFDLQVSSKVEKVEPVKVSTMLGLDPLMPQTVKVHYKGIAELCDVKVNWEQAPTHKYNKVGSFKLKGTLEGIANVKAEATVKVVTQSSLQMPTKVATVSGTKPSLPTRTRLYNAEGVLSDYVLDWDLDPYSYTGPVGKQTVVTGMITSDSDWSRRRGTGAPLSVTVEICAPEHISGNKKHRIRTEEGVEPSLPTSVPVELADGTTVLAGIDWAEIDPEEYENAGETFTVEGLVQGFDGATKMALVDDDDRSGSEDGLVTAEVSVVGEGEVTALQPRTVVINAVQGTAVENCGLPSGLGTTYSDGAVTDDDDEGMAVTWDTSKVDMSKPGSYTVTGKYVDAELADLSPTAVINVVAPDTAITSVSETSLTVAKGTTVDELLSQLPATVQAKYSDGTSDEVAVNYWNLDPVSGDALNQVGQFVLEGVVANGEAEATCTVTVAGNDSETPVKADELGTVEVLEHSSSDEVKGRLPSVAHVTMKDGSTCDCPIEWQQVPSTGAAGETLKATGTTANGLIDVRVQLKVVARPAAQRISILVNGKKQDEGSVVKVKRGDSVLLVAAVDPADAYQDVEWEIADSEIASVSGNTLKALHAGKTTLRAKPSRGAAANIQASVQIEVYEDETNAGAAVGSNKPGSDEQVAKGDKQKKGKKDARAALPGTGDISAGAAAAFGVAGLSSFLAAACALIKRNKHIG